MKYGRRGLRQRSQMEDQTLTIQEVVSSLCEGSARPGSSCCCPLLSQFLERCIVASPQQLLGLIFHSNWRMKPYLQVST